MIPLAFAGGEATQLLKYVDSTLRRFRTRSDRVSAISTLAHLKWCRQSKEQMRTPPSRLLRLFLFFVLCAAPVGTHNSAVAQSPKRASSLPTRKLQRQPTP